MENTENITQHPTVADILAKALTGGEAKYMNSTTRAIIDALEKVLTVKETEANPQSPSEETENNSCQCGDLCEERDKEGAPIEINLNGRYFSIKDSNGIKVIDLSRLSTVCKNEEYPKEIVFYCADGEYEVYQPPEEYLFDEAFETISEEIWEYIKTRD